MTLKIKTPPAIEPDGPWHWQNIKTGKTGFYEEDPRQFGIDLEHPEYKWVRLPSAAQLAARDAQWLELVGPVVKSLADALESVVDYRHGMEFGTCDDEAITNGRAALRAITEEQE